MKTGIIRYEWRSRSASAEFRPLYAITRVLGSRVEKVTATDIWLMLEAAYWHDSGMAELLHLETSTERRNSVLMVPVSGKAGLPDLGPFQVPWYQPTIENVTSPGTASMGLGPTHRVTYDSLLALFPYARLIAVSRSERRYLLWRDSVEQPTTPAFRNLTLHGTTADQENALFKDLVVELKYLPSLNRTQRVVWQLLEGCSLLAVNTSGSATNKVLSKV